ncbi:MAG: Unknown protein [uncultured Sulfurovum sp.]|uniref:Phosphoadenosine phosphosulphate reductase domain-containing protein n=1 Tax=uncultured Sulfurovum sp. TaxID=269237 RepID=A0A6S6SCD4_9BACT|nr:MAG: Unknown protein [uncultured Sulfurovum sp.]
MENLSKNNLFDVMGLQIKVDAAKKVLIKAYNENNGKLFISYSAGKDSTILRHIALSLYPDLEVVFSNTSNELKEVLEYAKKTPNVIIVNPKMNFKQVIMKYGFPLVSKEISQKVNEIKRTHGKRTRLKRMYGDHKNNGKLSNKWRFLAEQSFDVTEKCCKILKKDPLENWGKSRNLKPIIALMKDESNLRKQLSLYGKDDGNKIYPFLKTGWTEEDIFLYADLHNIRFAECYYDRIVDGVLVKKRDRTGCEYCMFGIDQEKTDRFERSRILTPKRFKANMKIENNGVTFEEAYNLIKYEEHPIVLDLYGGITVGMKNLPNHWNAYTFKNKTIQKVCPYCESRKIQKDFPVQMTFLDTPEEDGTKRVIFVTNEYMHCKECGGNYINDLHLFDFRFNVTKRVVDYIYKNLSKKSIFEVSSYIGISVEDLHEILNYYRADFQKALKNKQSSIWFVNNI